MSVPFWRRCALHLFRVKVFYADVAKQLEDGPSIIICNHESLLDGVIIAFASPRPLHFAINTNHSLRHPIITPFLRWLEKRGLGTIVPIDNTSIYGIRALRKALDAGEPILIFPAGRRTLDPTLEHPGYRWLHEKTGAPIVRAHIDGANRSRLFALRGKALWPRITLTL